MPLRLFLPICLLFFLSLFSLPGCSNPIIPASVPDPTTTQASSTRSLLGLWRFYIDPVNQTLDFTPLRSPATHMNALAFMEPPAGASLSIEQFVDVSPGQITVDIAITHPYPTMSYATAFDITGILISHGTMSYTNYPVLKFAGDDAVRLLNPDGYTRWWNPVEFPMNTETPYDGYIDGLLGTPNSVGQFTSTLNPYRYFASDLTDPETPLSELDTSTRGAFLPGTKSVRRHVIGYTEGNLVFNYAVNASWAPPTVMPPVSIPDDFPSSANAPEPWRAELKNVVNTLSWDPVEEVASGSYSMSVYVYDWYNAGTTFICSQAQGNELNGYCNPFPAEVADDYAVFNYDLVPMDMVSSADVLLWLAIQTEVGGFQGYLPTSDRQGIWINETIPVAEE